MKMLHFYKVYSITVCVLVIVVTEKMEPPVFVTKPVNKDVKEEGKATFECKIKGKPLPEVTWSAA